MWQGRIDVLKVVFDGLFGEFGECEGLRGTCLHSRTLRVELVVGGRGVVDEHYGEGWGVGRLRLGGCEGLLARRLAFWFERIGSWVD